MRRTLLLSLLLNINRPVTLDWLSEALWEGEPPLSATANLRTYAGGLRRVLTTEMKGVGIVASDRAYQLVASPGKLDLTSFEKFTTQARTALAERRHDVAVQRFDDAMALWRGPAGDGLPYGKPLAARLAVLQEQRLAALEDRAEARLVLGRHSEVVADLRLLVGEQPLRERAWALLMRALYGSGDAAGALGAYAEARDHLAVQLGLEPGEELRRVHRAVLHRDPALAPAVRHQARLVPAASPAPRQLPRPGLLVGRDREAEFLEGALTSRGTVPPVAVVSGPVGVGKSALALRVAHAMAGRFPDGQLYVDMAGAFHQERAVTAPQAVSWFLRALGDSASGDELSLGEASTRLRSLTSGLRVLFVVDNVIGSAQVRPLLPSGPGCAVLVTSRRVLPLDHAEHLTLDVLGTQDAVAMLAGHAGRDRVDAEPDAAARIARLCEHLPLALRAAGVLLAARPDWSLERMAGQLPRGICELLDHWDEQRIRDRLWASYELYRQNDPEAARLLWMISHQPGSEVSVSRAAELLCAPGPCAQRALDRLTDEHLLRRLSPDRYEMVGLLRILAPRDSP
ncbi:BTAD domain-containing putative transcriptional regulator [Sphaerisporangium sp. NPDC051011]|uniref:AfsR/SARP family transcriptional regulator n=1 Tax=Sphaerisporangium sp. NPDC051011 TaxID=3155792 RepID=UPI0033D3733B